MERDMKYLIKTHPSNIKAYNDMMDAMNSEADEINGFLGSKMVKVEFKDEAMVPLFSLEVKNGISEEQAETLESGLSEVLGFEIKIVPE